MQRLSSFMFSITFIFFSRDCRWLPQALSLYYLCSFRHKPPEDKMAFLITIPLLGQTFKLFNSYFLSLQLSNLLQAGLSVYDSLKAFESQPFLRFHKNEAKRLIERLKQGESLEQMLAGHPFYENDLAKAVAHGQLNGHLYREPVFI